jgi:hypothetical protein
MIRDLWYRVVTPPCIKGSSRVTSKRKYLPLNHNCCVGEIERKLRAKQEVMNSNPGHHMHAYFA